MRRLIAITLLIGLLYPFGCASEPVNNPTPAGAPVVRVRLIDSAATVSVSVAADRPIVRIGSMPLNVSFPPGPALQVGLGHNGWIVGNQQLPAGDLVIQPTKVGSVRVNGMAYRGELRFVAASGGKFDVINYVEIDDYLKGVVAKEMLPDWAEEAYKAQAIVARTYAMYAVAYHADAEPGVRSWDLFPDQRSQMYGGLAGETDKSRRAVDATAGMVVAYGPVGDERIFKAYFSSCCGGISVNPTDGLGEPFLPAMVEQNVGQLCSASPRFNWGPIVISKSELTRRFKLFGKAKGRAEANLTQVARIDRSAVNRYGRPVRFTITDAGGKQYSLSGEELRWAVNIDAPRDSTVFSSFIESADAGANIKFTGHGYGHGVGMCQWCAQTRALQGMSHDDIVRQAFLGAVVKRAY